MKYLLLGITILAITQCKTTSSSKFSSAGLSTQIENTEWNTYVNDIRKNEDIQDLCYPTSYKHQTEKQEGVIILIHGFTACPQQYFDVAERLASKGWDVLLPLNPGHGKIRGPKEHRDLPTLKNYNKVMPAFVARINRIMSNYSAEKKVIAGISLGGAYATSAIVEAPDLYDRALIAVPLYKSSGIVAGFLGGVKNIEQFNQWITPGIPTLNSLILNTTVSWGKNCEDEVKKGRAGTCRFNISNLVGPQQFGYDLSASKTVSTRVQYIVVENDDAVDSRRIINFYNNNVKTPESDRSICVYRAPTSHSIGSKYDKPDEDKFWLKSFEDNFVDFVHKNEFYPHGKRTILGKKECFIP